MENRIQDAFSYVKADTALKESTKDFLAKKREEQACTYRTRAYRTRAVYRTLAAVCAMLILAVGLGGYQWAQTPVSYVSIDVNPSIELGLNRFERVVTAEAYNPEGEEILQGLSLIGKKYREAIDSVVESEAMERYLTKEEELVLTVAAKGSKEKAIETTVTDYSKSVGKNCHSVSADIETAASAHNNGMSVGKYNAYLQLLQYDSEVTLDECKHMSMSQIHGLLNEHRHGEKDHEEQQQRTEDGSSHGEQHQKAEDESSHGAKQQKTENGSSQNEQPKSTDGGKHQGKQDHSSDDGGKGTGEHHHRKH